MKLDVPDEIVRRAEANQIELRLALALQLYSDNRIDYSDACTLADVPDAIFNCELLKRHISVQKYPARKTAG